MAGILDTPLPPTKPDRPCSVCGSDDWWFLVSNYGSGWRCSRCHPNPNKEVTNETERVKEASTD